MNWVCLFDLASLRKKARELEEETYGENFWDQVDRAQKTMQELNAYKKEIEEYENLENAIEDLEVLIELALEEDAADIHGEIKAAYQSIEELAEDFRLATLLDGEYDKNNAIFSIHSGAGGLEAQDWAEILLRMYKRWADRKGYGVEILDYQSDTEGGIKSVTMYIKGFNAYGYLKSERGVHRLVRISPFDSSNRRHTSFASIDIYPEIDDDMEVEIQEADLKIDTYRASGAGGQHVNTTDSAVRITHLPTGITVQCQNERSQHSNRLTAMRLLKAKLIQLKEEEHKEKIEDLQGKYTQIAWGSQIRSYIFHPYTLVKDHRTDIEVGDINKVIDGDIDIFINEYLKDKAF